MDAKAMAKVFKALSNDNRLILFLEIYKNEKISVEAEECSCACFISDIVAKLKVGAPTISHHIKELENAGLIHTEKIGKQITATVNKEAIQTIIEILDPKI